MVEVAKVFFTGALLTSSGFILTGCADSGDRNLGSTPVPADNSSTNSTSSPTGEVSLAVTDAPVDGVSRVRVTFNKVELQPAEGDKITVQLDPPVTVDNLLDLTGNESQTVLEPTTVPAGAYSYMRVYMVGGSPDSEVEEDTGGLFDLLLPGQQPGEVTFIEPVSAFTVPVGDSADFTADIDLRMALDKPDGAGFYLLRPRLRGVNNAESGTITGTVAPSLFTDSSCTNSLGDDEGVAVYLYRKDRAGFGDIYINNAGECQHCDEGSETEESPLATANVTQNLNSGTYEYTIGFVAAGEYGIALTCQALDDDPAVNDEISFLQSSELSVAAEQTTEANFSP